MDLLKDIVVYSGVKDGRVPFCPTKARSFS